MPKIWLPKASDQEKWLILANSVSTSWAVKIPPKMVPMVLWHCHDFDQNICLKLTIFLDFLEFSLAWGPIGSFIVDRTSFIKICNKSSDGWLRWNLSRMFLKSIILSKLPTGFNDCFQLNLILSYTDSRRESKGSRFGQFYLKLLLECNDKANRR